jgi:hypothetical protein
VAALRQGGADVQAATLGQGLISDPIDKVVTFFVVYLILAAMAVRAKARFPQGERLVERRDWRERAPDRSRLPHAARRDRLSPAEPAHQAHRRDGDRDRSRRPGRLRGSDRAARGARARPAIVAGVVRRLVRTRSC